MPYWRNVFIVSKDEVQLCTQMQDNFWIGYVKIVEGLSIQRHYISLTEDKDETHAMCSEEFMCPNEIRNITYVSNIKFSRWQAYISEPLGQQTPCIGSSHSNYAIAVAAGGYRDTSVLVLVRRPVREGEKMAPTSKSVASF